MSYLGERGHKFSRKRTSTNAMEKRKRRDTQTKGRDREKHGGKSPVAGGKQCSQQTRKKGGGREASPKLR